MKRSKGYNAVPLSFTRKMIIASVNSNKKNAIHCLTKIDVSKSLLMRKKHFDDKGEKLSFTAYIIKCFAEAIKEFPEMNSFIKGNKLILLDDINISIMVEREIDGVKVPEPLGLQKVQDKTVTQIHEEIRNAQKNMGNELGNLTNTAWIKYIPRFLIRIFIKLAERNIKMAKRYGKVAVTAVGMFSSSASWFIPHGTATVLLTIGSISKENTHSKSGESDFNEMLHITASFNHEIIDGAPAARFMKHFEKILQSGELFDIS
ncbi:MAG: 2-oxo acid dehydrogenase subunit E2 [bacterium]|nr:2-oxo acid dehydrogenase subunit E2 [bacterium]